MGIVESSEKLQDEEWLKRVKFCERYIEQDSCETGWRSSKVQGFLNLTLTPTLSGF